jgi:hypothetical protein
MVRGTGAWKQQRKFNSARLNARRGNQNTVRKESFRIIHVYFCSSRDQSVWPCSKSLSDIKKLLTLKRKSVNGNKVLPTVLDFDLQDVALESGFPEIRVSHTVTLVNGKAFVIGGQNEDGTALKTVGMFEFPGKQFFFVVAIAIPKTVLTDQILYFSTTFCIFR